MTKQKFTMAFISALLLIFTITSCNAIIAIEENFLDETDAEFDEETMPDEQEEEFEFDEENQYENEEGDFDEGNDEEAGQFSNAANQDIKILAIGDSIFDGAEDGSSIPEVVGQSLNVNVVNNAVGGAHLNIGSGEESDIRSQYVSGDWDWIIMDGGGNDLNDSCGCGACDAEANSIISADGLNGDLPEFIDQIATGDTKVIFMTYYQLPDGAEYGFDRCNEWNQELRSRVVTLAASNDSVFEVYAGDVVAPTDLQYFAEDRVHPSAAGAEVMGEYIAQTIQAAE